MRQIKFRVWNKKLLRFVAKVFIGPINISGNRTHPNNGLIGATFNTNEIDLETQRSEDCLIQQFTGFFDKNGNEIYDEDIVSINGDNFVVVWQSDGFWCFHDLKNKVTIDPWNITSYCGKENKKNFELVGNRFESENLLGI